MFVVKGHLKGDVLFTAVENYKIYYNNRLPKKGYYKIKKISHDRYVIISHVEIKS